MAIRLTILVIMSFMPGIVGAWGFYGHRLINRMAVYLLPPEMMVLYKPNIEFLAEHAVDPDKRRYAVNGEATRHFIDLDRYGFYPYTDLPRKWDEAIQKFSEDTILAHGTVLGGLKPCSTDLLKLSEPKTSLPFCALVPN